MGLCHRRAAIERGGVGLGEEIAIGGRRPDETGSVEGGGEAVGGETAGDGTVDGDAAEDGAGGGEADTSATGGDLMVVEFKQGDRDVLPCIDAAVINMKCGERARQQNSNPRGPGMEPGVPA